MITNSRLLELRTTGLECQKRVDLGVATHLEKEYAELFQLIVSGGLPTSGNDMGSNINFLLGK